MFKKIIETYIKWVISEIDIEYIVKDEIKKSIRDTILHTNLSQKIQDESAKYVESQIDTMSIKKIVYRSVWYYIKDAIGNMKTFADLGRMTDKKLEELIKK